MKKLFLGLALLAGSLGMGYGCNTAGNEQASLIAKTKREYPAYVVASNIDEYVVPDLKRAKKDISRYSYKSGKTHHTHYPKPDVSLKRLEDLMTQMNNISLFYDEKVKDLEDDLIVLQQELSGIERGQNEAFYTPQRDKMDELVHSFEVIKYERLCEVPQETKNKIADLNSTWWSKFLLALLFGIPGVCFLGSYIEDRKRYH